MRESAKTDIVTAPTERAERIAREHDYVQMLWDRDFRSPAAYANIHYHDYGPEESPPHAIDFLEFLVVVSGESFHLSARGAIPIGPGSVVVLRPGAWQAIGECRGLIVAVLCLSVGFLGTDLAFLRERPRIRDLLFASHPDSESGVLMTAVPPEVAAEFAAELRKLGPILRERPRDRTLVTGQVLVAIGTLTSGMELSEQDAASDHPAVTATLERLDASPETHWTVNGLAREVNLDPAYLARLFRAEVGIPPMTYLARIRAERASRLLADPLLSVAHIGAAVGWPDPTQFTRRFRALVGMTPRAYRERVRRGTPTRAEGPEEASRS